MGCVGGSKLKQIKPYLVNDFLLEVRVEPQNLKDENCAKPSFP